MGEGKKKQGPRLRLSPEKRDRFLEVLGQTGNRRAAARAIGVEERLMDQRREFDAVLDRQWEEALDQAHRRLSGADGPFDCVGGRELNVIRRGKDLRLKIVNAGAKRWTKATEDRFFAALATCGNLAAAARSIGFHTSSVYQRRRKWPEFARRLDEALDDAEMQIEFKRASMGSDLGLLGGTERPASPGSALQELEEESGEALQFDADLAFRFLKYRDGKRQGRKLQRGRPEKVWSFDEAMESLEKSLEAFGARYERQQLKEGWTKDGLGRMIPPGWVKADPDAPDLPDPDESP